MTFVFENVYTSIQIHNEENYFLGVSNKNNNKINSGETERFAENFRISICDNNETKYVKKHREQPNKPEKSTKLYYVENKMVEILENTAEQLFRVSA